MPTSKVTVSSGEHFVSNVKVVLEWSDFVYLGKSDPVYTSSDGIAVIKHFATGSATIYINGKKFGRMNTPRQENS